MPMKCESPWENGVWGDTFPTKEELAQMGGAMPVLPPFQMEKAVIDPPRETLDELRERLAADPLLVKSLQRAAAKYAAQISVTPSPSPSLPAPGSP